MKSSKLPVQAMPVERTGTGSTLSSGNGVDASFNWGALGGALLNALPGVISAI